MDNDFISEALKRLPLLPLEEQKTLLKMLDQYERARKIELARTDFLTFAQLVDPNFKVGSHHRIINQVCNRIAKGELKRVIINIAPRHGKSHIMSYLFPAWYVGQHPDHKIIQATHTSDLSVDFGRKVRNLVGTDIYGQIFPKVGLSSDSKAAGKWNTNHEGEYYAVGVGGALAGRGAHLCVVDDPVSEQAVLSASSAAFEQSNNWFMSGPRQRLMPGGAICIIQTRWATNDMTGFLIDNMVNNPDGDNWEVVELPMELPSGEPLWPEFWSKQDIAKLKATLPSKYWQAQYQQNPTADEGALIKREWWQRWPHADPPRCEFTISAWDTAFEKSSKADFSAMTYWGVFKNEEDDDNYHIILLDARRERIEFPDLKVWARKHWTEEEPDCMVVEKKATGAPLIYEMRQMGIPIQEYTPVRGQDKVTRVNAISPLFETSRVWAPRTRWAEEVIEECAAFPNGKHDDYVDTVSLALLRMRMGGLVRAANDEDDTRINKFKRRRTYY